MHYHPEFEIDQRVEFRLGTGESKTGQIAGIARDEVGVALYIILLDDPFIPPGQSKPWKAVAVDGTRLTPVLPTHTQIDCLKNLEEVSRDEKQRYYTCKICHATYDDESVNRIAQSNLPGQ